MGIVVKGAALDDEMPPELSPLPQHQAQPLPSVQTERCVQLHVGHLDMWRSERHVRWEEAKGPSGRLQVDRSRCQSLARDCPPTKKGGIVLALLIYGEFDSIRLGVVCMSGQGDRLERLGGLLPLVPGPAPRALSTIGSQC